MMVYDATASKVAWDILAGEAGIKSVTFSPDGKRVYACGTTGCVCVFDAETGKKAQRWLCSRSGQEEFGYRAENLTVSADGRFVACGTSPDGDVYVWNAETGKLLQRISPNLGTTATLAFSPDSRRLAVVSLKSHAVDVFELSKG